MRMNVNPYSDEAHQLSHSYKSILGMCLAHKYYATEINNYFAVKVTVTVMPIAIYVGIVS